MHCQWISPAPEPDLATYPRHLREYRDWGAGAGGWVALNHGNLLALKTSSTFLPDHVMLRGKGSSMIDKDFQGVTDSTYTQFYLLLDPKSISLRIDIKLQYV